VLVACLQLPYLLDVEDRIELCESMLAKEEFDLLALPAAWADGVFSDPHSTTVEESAMYSYIFRRYIRDLSARKHATIVAGTIEKEHGAAFECAIVASLGVDCGQFLKDHPFSTKPQFRRPWFKKQWEPLYGSHYSLGVVYDSDLRCESQYLPLRVNYINICVVVGGSTDCGMPDRVRWRAMECGVTLVYANLCDPWRQLPGQSGIVSPHGNWHVRASNTPAFIQCELPSAVVAYGNAYGPKASARERSKYRTWHGFPEPPRASWWWW